MTVRLSCLVFVIWFQDWGWSWGFCYAHVDWCSLFLLWVCSWFAPFLSPDRHLQKLRSLIQPSVPKCIFIDCTGSVDQIKGKRLLILHLCFEQPAKHPEIGWVGFIGHFEGAWMLCLINLCSRLTLSLYFFISKCFICDVHLVFVILCKHFCSCRTFVPQSCVLAAAPWSGSSWLNFVALLLIK